MEEIAVHIPRELKNKAAGMFPAFSFAAVIKMAVEVSSSLWPHGELHTTRDGILVHKGGKSISFLAHEWRGARKTFRYKFETNRHKYWQLQRMSKSVSITPGQFVVCALAFFLRMVELEARNQPTGEGPEINTLTVNTESGEEVKTVVY